MSTPGRPKGEYLSAQRAGDPDSTSGLPIGEDRRVPHAGSPAGGPRAVIAEDEPLLATSLRDELARAWPELRIEAIVGNGDDAVEIALQRRPDVLFLDIRMPGLSGLEAARALAEDWPDDGEAFPLIVFATAYDQYAVQAFERAAFDYLLKPIAPARLAQTIARLRAALAARSAGPAADPATNPMAESAAGTLASAVERLRGLLAGVDPSHVPLAQAPLRVIQAGVGNAIHLVPVDEVVFFEAADKYVRVLTAEREYLIRTSLRELLPRLDAGRFWQVHRSVVVRADAIAAALRDEAGKVTLSLQGRPEKLVVSRLHAHLFKAM